MYKWVKTQYEVAIEFDYGVLISSFKKVLTYLPFAFFHILWSLFLGLEEFQGSVGAFSPASANTHAGCRPFIPSRKAQAVFEALRLAFIFKDKIN